MNQKLFKNLPLLIFLVFLFGPILGKFGPFVIIFFIVIYLLIRKSGNLPFLKGKRSAFSGADAIDLDKIKNMKNIKSFGVSIVLLFFFIWLFFASIVIVDAGETGVYSLFGKVKDQELRSGFHLVIPLAKVTKMSIRTEEYTMSVIQGEGKKYGSDAIAALTKEGLNVDLDMTVLYRVNEEKASSVYSEVGLTYDEKIIRPSIRTSIRDVIAEYEAKDIYSAKRQEAAAKIKTNLSISLENRGIIIEDVLLRNVVLPPNLANAIQEKLQAEQEAEKYDFILTKESKEKERKVIEAEGQRDAQSIINESLSTNYLYYLYVSNLKDRQGTIYVPTGTGTGVPLFRNLGN